ncbi:hypothetical protein [Providencia alcalifaciens]|uniref:hypothetical protein n=1 Tax=Providencia alcalifaciens TaxID=126385 RepID=UPI0003E23722|nr:hypothetical protein [Providencia alcalifaciens]ETS99963.1 hypothetical protein HMPREF1568_0494 [Providencia alcalifaciens PAL-3]EUD01139.1 hypothetical protein HMPREF1566_3083 [Providencia alcalifaciens PAL-1]
MSENKAIHKIGKTVLEEIVNAVGLGCITNISKSIYEARMEIDNDKLYEFVVELKKHDIKENAINNENFVSIVKRLYIEDEVSKSKLYARLAISLSEDSLTKDDRVYYINTISQLTNADIELAKKIYIYSSYDIKGYLNRGEQVKKLTTGNTGILLKSKNNLISNGLIYDEKSGAIEANPAYEITKELRNFISFIFNEEELSPNAIGCDSKNYYDVIIVDHFKSYKNLYVSYLYDKLKSNNLKVIVIERNELDLSEVETKIIVNTNKLLKSSSGRREEDYIEIKVSDKKSRDEIRSKYGSEEILEDKFFNHKKVVSYRNELISVLDKVVSRVLRSIS